MKNRISQTKKHTMRFLRERSLLLIILLVIVTGFGSFVVWDSNQTKTFKLDEGIAHFQFDYPADMAVKTAIVTDRIEMTLSGADDYFYTWNTVTSLGSYSIWASPRNYFFNTEKTDFLVLLNDRMDSFTESVSSGVQLSRTEIMVDGHPGLRDIHSFISSDNRTIVRMMVIFYYNGLEWIIDNSFIDSMMEEGIKTFDGIVRSFRFFEQSDTEDPDVVSFTLEEGNIHFSFSHASRYHLDVYQLDEIYTIVPTSVYLSGPVSRYNGIEDFPIIEVQFYQSDYESNAAEYTSDRLASLSSKTSYRKLSDEVIRVSGIDTRWITCSYLDYNPRNFSWYPANGTYDFWPVTLPRPIHTVTSFVYLDHHEFVAKISMESNIATSETDVTNFEHILETFKILN